MASSNRTTLNDMKERATKVTQKDIKGQLERVREVAPDLFAILTLNTLRVGLMVLEESRYLPDDPLPADWGYAPVGDDPVPFNPGRKPVPLSGSRPRPQWQPLPSNPQSTITYLFDDPAWLRYFRATVELNKDLLPGGSCEELCHTVGRYLRARWYQDFRKGNIYEPGEFTCDCD